MAKSHVKNTALHVAVIALFVALATGVKQALAVVPNVEIVTLLVAVSAFVWGFSVGVPVAVVFVAIQMVIYGFGTWVLEYFLHFPLLAVAFALLGKVPYKRKLSKVVVVTAVAVVFTLAFGVMTSLVDTLLTYSATDGFGVHSNDFWHRYAILYGRGIPFFVTHVLCNLAFFVVGFLPLEKANRLAKLRMFGC